MRVPALRAAVIAVVTAVLALASAALPGRAYADDGDSRPVLFIGIPGLAWSDADTVGELLAAPDLGTASLVVRSTGPIACPLDGWLAISAGNRVSGDQPCAPVPDITTEEGAQAWQQWRAQATTSPYGAEVGLLGDRLAEAGVTTTAIGAGAAVALSTSAGEVELATSGADLGAQVTAALATSDLVVVDLDPATASADLPSVLAAADGDQDPVIIVSGISDEADAGAPALRLFATLGWGAGGELTSASTRQPGYLLATDQHATILDLLGLDSSGTSAIGAPMAEAGGGEDGLVAAALDRERHAHAQHGLTGAFFVGLGVVLVALVLVVVIGLRRPTRELDDPRRGRVLLSAEATALGVGALGVAATLANLVPWWRVEPAAVGLVAATALAAAAVAAVALLPLWRRWPLGPPAVVAAITVLVLGIDVLLGAPAQVSGPLGFPTLVAGRFYGMHNTSFALAGTAALLLATVVGNALLQAGRRLWAAAAVAAIGVVTIAIDGAPFWGADFGGPPALLVAFGLLALLAAGVRLTVKRVLLVVLGAGALTLVIAVLDWLRPASARTHLGRFVADVLDGDLWPVLVRKLDQNLTIVMGSRVLTIAAIVAVVAVVIVSARPIRAALTAADGGGYRWLTGGRPIAQITEAAPLLVPGIVAIGVCAVIGFAVNDSGIAIVANSALLAVPLLLAAVASWLRDPGQAPR